MIQLETFDYDSLVLWGGIRESRVEKTFWRRLRVAGL
jgi:hypothetical protein